LRGEIEMLQEKNSELKQLHEYLEALRKYEEVDMGDEPRWAVISDERTRIKSATEQGSYSKAIKIAENLLSMGLPVEQVAKGTGLSIDKIIEIKKSIL